MNHLGLFTIRDTRPDLSELDGVRVISNGRVVDKRIGKKTRRLNDHLLRDIGYFRHRWDG